MSDVVFHRVLEKMTTEEYDTIIDFIDIVGSGSIINNDIPDKNYIECICIRSIEYIWRIRKIAMAEGKKSCNCGENADSSDWWKIYRINLRDNLKRFEVFEYINANDEVGVLKYTRGPFQNGIQDSRIAAKAIANDVVLRAKALMSMEKI